MTHPSVRSLVQILGTWASRRAIFAFALAHIPTSFTDCLRYAYRWCAESPADLFTADENFQRVLPQQIHHPTGVSQAKSQVDLHQK